VTITDVVVGQAVWAYCRHYWREVRIVGKGRSRVVVAYRLSVGGRLVRQDLALWNLRLEKPVVRNRYDAVLAVAAPELAEALSVTGGGA
jgi:hypothetical protein